VSDPNRHVVFKPQRLTAQELEAGYWRVYREFYRWGSIWRGASSKAGLRPRLRTWPMPEDGRSSSHSCPRNDSHRVRKPASHGTAERAAALRSTGGATDPGGGHAGTGVNGSPSAHYAGAKMEPTGCHHEFTMVGCQPRRVILVPEALGESPRLAAAPVRRLYTGLDSDDLYEIVDWGK
jgi:hypothetical protein